MKGSLTGADPGFFNRGPSINYVHTKGEGGGGGGRAPYTFPLRILHAKNKRGGGGPNRM